MVVLLLSATFNSIYFLLRAPVHYYIIHIFVFVYYYVDDAFLIIVSFSLSFEERQRRGGKRQEGAVERTKVHKINNNTTTIDEP